jgi:hypothetical protein
MALKFVAIPGFDLEADADERKTLDTQRAVNFYLHLVARHC